MADRVALLFTYGTLMPGSGIYHRIEEHVHRCRPATVSGTLVDLGAFPALLPGDGVIRGVLLDITPEGLRIADQIEGHRPERRGCFYQRRTVKIHLDDGDMATGWTYFFARPESAADRPPLVVGEQDGVPIYAWRSQ